MRKIILTLSIALFFINQMEAQSCTPDTIYQDSSFGIWPDTAQDLPPAAAGIAYSLEGKKDYSGAILKYKSIIESPSTFPLFHIFLSLARCYESNNDRNSALLTLREMNGRFSKHSKLDLVKTRIKKLEKLI